LTCCKPQERLNGLWFFAYTQTDNQDPHYTLQRTFFEFDSDSVHIISIGDFSTGDLGAVNTESGTFVVNESSLAIEIKGWPQFGIIASKDSLILTHKENPETKTILKRINADLRSANISANCFNGSYLLQGYNYQDSIDFINDSILLQTGKYNMNFPGNKWEIVTYKNYNFINIHEELFPLTVIRSCSREEVILESLFKTNYTITLTPTTTSINTSDFYGKWIEIEGANSVPKPPMPPGYGKEDRLLQVEFDSDSVRIKNFRQDERIKWDLSNDGKRIYFIDKVLENEGSWKILAITEDILVVRISSHSGFTEEIVKLKRN